MKQSELPADYSKKIQIDKTIISKSPGSVLDYKQNSPPLSAVLKSLLKNVSNV